MNSTDISKYSFIFSGAGMNNSEYISEIIKNADLSCIIKDYSYLAKFETGINVWDTIAHMQSDVIDNELVDQILSYTLNCAIAKFYKEQLGIRPQALCGYSMGIYSALVCGEAISFKCGLNIVKNAFYFMKKAVKGQKGAMASIIGFKHRELEEIISASNTTMPVEIANDNSEYNMVITGLLNDVQSVMQKSAEEGALKVIKIKVNLPYHHSTLLVEAAEELSFYLEKVEINDLCTPLVSSIDQSTIQSSSDIRYEIYKNIKQNMSWYKSVQKIAAMGVDSFIEVGGGNSLQKISKSINRSYITQGIKDTLGGCHGLQLIQSV